MKTTKILIALCIVLGFATNAVKAQPAVTEKGIYSGGYYIDCAGEWANGDLMYSYVGNKNRYQLSWHGKLIGEESGTVYIINDGGGQLLILDKGVVWSFYWTFMIHADGKPIMKYKALAHVTVNANGTLTVEFYREGGGECLNN